MIDYRAQAEALREELIARRRDLHRHPELAFEETRTAGIVAEELSALGFEVQTGIGKTGVVGVLDGAEDGATVLWRADMDALPVHEMTGVDYASTVPGKMHACGHDGHVSVALGIAKLMSQHRDQIKGRVKFIFQPAEEIVAGALAMIHDGVLDHPRPDVALGLHLWNAAPLGKIGVVDGAMMASSSVVKIKVIGSGGHAAMPQWVHDPVVCAAQIILALQTVVSRNIDPMETVVLSITMMKGSDADNIIPESAELAGTLRAYSISMRDLATERIIDIAESLARAMGCRAEVMVKHGPLPVVNDGAVASRLRSVFESVVGAAHIDPAMRTMAAEDMAAFLQEVPGTYFFVGAANAEKGLHYPHHHEKFNFDEDALPLAVALGAAAIGAYVF